MNNKTTLKDIAKLAGISVNSVSKALRDSKSISKQTKEKVRAIADSLDYVKDQHASSLRSGKYKVIAIVYDHLTNPYYALMLESLYKFISLSGYESMIFIERHGDGFLTENCVKRILSFAIGGIITFLEPTDKASILIKSNNIPTVLIGRQGDRTSTPSVFSNDFRGGELAAENLINGGGKNFVYISEHSHLTINGERLNGFVKGLKNNGFNIPKSHILSGTDETTIFKEFQSLISIDKQIDSIFCFSDMTAYKVIKVLNENGKKVPEEVQVIGFDNTKEATPYPLEISSISPQKDNTAQVALNLLKEQIDNKENIQIKYIKVEVEYFKGNTTRD